MRHASPPSKKRQAGKIAFSSFDEAQHPVVSDRRFRWSLCDPRRVPLLAGAFSTGTLSCGSGAAHCRI